jgi:CRISPR-associated endonuclease Cas1
MAATPTVSQRLQFRKSAQAAEQPKQSSTEPPTLRAGRHGVVTLFGYGIKISVERGHLTLEDGIGADRHKWRFSRVGHGLKRLVVIGNDGFVSLAALRWLADQDAAFVMLERDGSVLATTGPTRASDARLRRSQALAFHSGAALRIARELITQKLAGQQQVAGDKLRNPDIAYAIGRFKTAIATAETIPEIRVLEARAGATYFSAWHDLPINFPKMDLARVPEHWRTFGTRRSVLTGSPRLATNPPNAILNYLFAALASEARLAAAALGLDPCIGVLHYDTAARDSLAYDLMEPVRPQVDAFLLSWIVGQTLRRESFFEDRHGNCRLMGPFAAKLAETAPNWARAVAPFAERVVKELWSSIAKSPREPAPPTLLTQARKREAVGRPPMPPPMPTPRPENVCKLCGLPIKRGPSHCPRCAITASTVRLTAAAPEGRRISQSADAQASRAKTQRRHAAERAAWEPTSLPSWLTHEFYAKKIQPHLAAFTSRQVSRAIGVSIQYAIRLRSGQCGPHPRHWVKLAHLVGFSLDVHAG